MEFMNRGAAQPAARVNPAGAGGAAPTSNRRNGRWKDSPMWLRVIWVVLLFSVTVVVIALAALLYFGGPNESKQVDKDKYQAVFLANGQVYFSKIKNINSKFLDLKDIYYLNVNQQVQPNQSSDQQAQSSISLVKLGCELHGPVDQMIVNREQVTFWENLKDDGQVAKAIAEWVKQNPDGQKCQTATNNATTPTTGTNP